MSGYQYGARVDVESIVAARTEQHLSRIIELERALEAERMTSARIAASLATLKSRHKKVADKHDYWAESFDDPRFLALVDMHRERNKRRYRDAPEQCHARLVEAAREAAAHGTAGRNRKRTTA